MSALLDGVATSLLAAAAPSGTLEAVADANANPELDAAQAELDAVFVAVERHLAEPSLVSRLEDDFARAAPAVSDGANALEVFVMPSLALLLTPVPGGALISYGVQVAVKVALAVYKNWAARRLAK